MIREVADAASLTRIQGPVGNLDDAIPCMRREVLLAEKRALDGSFRASAGGKRTDAGCWMLMLMLDGRFCHCPLSSFLACRLTFCSVSAASGRPRPLARVLLWAAYRTRLEPVLIGQWLLIESLSLLICCRRASSLCSLLYS